MTDLSDKMRALAAKGHEKATDLRERADALDKAMVGFYSEPQTVTVQPMMSHWARARRLWCDCTGERLI